MHEQNAVFTVMVRCPSISVSEGWWVGGRLRNEDDFGAVFCRASIQCIIVYIVGGFLKPHLHSWPLVSPLPSFVHLSTSKQKPWVHAVLERHLVDTFKAFRLYNLSFFVVIFRVYFMILCFSTHSHLVHWYRFSCLFFLFPFITSFDWSQF